MKRGVLGEKPLGTEKRTHKLIPHMSSCPRIEPRVILLTGFRCDREEFIWLLLKVEVHGHRIPHYLASNILPPGLAIRTLRKTKWYCSTEVRTVVYFVSCQGQAYSCQSSYPSTSCIKTSECVGDGTCRAIMRASGSICRPAIDNCDQPERWGNILCERISSIGMSIPS